MPSKKVTQINSFAQMSDELKLNESYKSLLLGVLVVLFVAVMLIGYVKNRNTYNTQNTQKTVLSVKKENPNTKIFYTVQPGDDLKKISEKFFQTPDFYILIARTNHIENPDIIEENMKLTMPKIAKNELVPSALQTASTDPIKTDSYTVQDGDLLWNIAARSYGDGYKWKDIVTINNLQTPDAIFSGMILQLSR